MVKKGVADLLSKLRSTAGKKVLLHAMSFSPVSIPMLLEAHRTYRRFETSSVRMVEGTKKILFTTVNY
jgi:hypothetical protein